MWQVAPFAQLPTVEPNVPVPHRPLPHWALEWHEAPGSHAFVHEPPLQSAALLHMHFLLSGKQLWPTPHTFAALATVHVVWPQVPSAPLQAKPVLGQSEGA